MVRTFRSKLVPSYMYVHYIVCHRTKHTMTMAEKLPSFNDFIMQIHVKRYYCTKTQFLSFNRQITSKYILQDQSIKANCL